MNTLSACLEQLFMQMLVILRYGAITIRANDKIARLLVVVYGIWRTVFPAEIHYRIYALVDRYL